MKRLSHIRLARSLSCLLAGWLTLGSSAAAEGLSDRISKRLEGLDAHDDQRFSVEIGLENDNKLFGLLALVTNGLDGDDRGRTHATRIGATYRDKHDTLWEFRVASSLFTRLNGNTPELRDDAGNILFRDAEGREGFLVTDTFFDASGQQVARDSVSSTGEGFVGPDGQAVSSAGLAFIDRNGQRQEVDAATAFSVLDKKRTAVWFHEISDITTTARRRLAGTTWATWQATGGLTISNRKRRSPGATFQQDAFHTIRNLFTTDDLPEYDHQDDGGGINVGYLLGGGVDAAPRIRLAPRLALRLIGGTEAALRHIPSGVGLAGSFVGLTAGFGLDLGKRRPPHRRPVLLHFKQITQFYLFESAIEAISEIGLTVRFRHLDLIGAHRIYNGSPINGFYVYNKNNSTTDARIRVYW